MMSNFHSIWTTNKNTVVSHWKENFIENGNQQIFFYILYFNLVHLITMHYCMHFGKDNMNTFLGSYISIFWLSWNVEKNPFTSH